MTLKDLATAVIEKKYKHIPVHARPVLRLSDTSANALTKAILVYFEHHGIKAWRQASEGRYLQGREFKDMFGRVRQEKGMYIPRSKAAKGIGDVSAIIKGLFISIEVKYGKDRMSDDQRKFQSELEASGGKYFVVKTWDDFIFQIKKYIP